MNADKQRKNIKSQIVNHKSQIPIVWASNYSTGVNTLFWLTRKAAEILGPGFDLEVVEMHHRLKKDAPSGTARELVERLIALPDGIVLVYKMELLRLITPCGIMPQAVLDLMLKCLTLSIMIRNR